MGLVTDTVISICDCPNEMFNNYQKKLHILWCNIEQYDEIINSSSYLQLLNSTEPAWIFASSFSLIQNETTFFILNSQ